MHAAVNKKKPLNRHLRLSYISAEKFMNELINAIRYDKAQTFREKYRSIDVMLMDDIQFMAAKERKHVGRFHPLHPLYDGRKHIQSYSECPPRGGPQLAEKQHFSFDGGFIAVTQ